MALNIAKIISFSIARKLKIAGEYCVAKIFWQKKITC